MKKNALITLACFACSMLLACSSSSSALGAAAGGDCPTVGSKVCTNDDGLTQDEVDQCNQAKSSSCGSQYTDYLKCEGSNVKCVNGEADTSAASTACQSQLNAYSSCTTNGGGDAG